MRHYRPLLLQDLNLRLPGLRVRRLRLNRHLPETTNVRRHRHAHTQLLLYLGGNGLQRLGETQHPIRSGTLVFLPPGTAHAFRETAPRRPLCLVLDLDLRGAAKRKARLLRLTESDLTHIRHQLRALGQADSPLRTGTLVLDVLERLLAPLNWPERASPPVEEAPVVRRARRLLRQSEHEPPPLAELARRIGYQPDYLNRLLKQTCGLTLGQLRAEQRFLRARELLREPGTVADVADALGFADQNYFARWFKRQAGVSPSQWSGGAASRTQG